MSTLIGKISLALVFAIGALLSLISMEFLILNLFSVYFLAPVQETEATT